MLLLTSSTWFLLMNQFYLVFKLNVFNINSNNFQCKSAFAIPLNHYPAAFEALLNNTN